MPTRFYLSSTETVTQTPEFAAWSRTAEALRRSMSPVKDGSAITSTTIWANGAAAADESALARQFVSAPMAAGIAFSTSDTIKAQVRCMESAVNDNINRSPITVKVYSEDGTALRATLLGLGHVGLNTTEWIASTLTNKTIANGDALTANYTTVLGDILVIEMGGQVSAAGGASVLGTMSFGSASATDLGENETDTAAHNPWFEISRTISFATVVATASPTVLAITTFAPSLQFTTGLTPATASLAASAHVPTLKLSIVPPATTLTLTSFVPSLNTPVTPSTSAITTSTFTPTVDITENVTAIPVTASLTISTFGPTLPVPPNIIYLDPGGDAPQATGYFNSIVEAGGTASFDNTQSFVGVGSYKFNSSAGGDPIYAIVEGILGASRRMSFRFRYDGVPNDPKTVTRGVQGTVGVYSGGGFSSPLNASGDDGVYATAMPAKNAGQGHVYKYDLGDVLPLNADIDSVKIIYEWKVDTQSSEAISRVKIRVNGEEGPNHDNTDEPTTDTVVEVDVTDDFPMLERQFLLDGVFEVIAEARRGDTDTAHTQSWDYVKVEVGYHLPATIWRAQGAGGNQNFDIALTPGGSGVVVQFTDGAYARYTGITELSLNTWPRIGLAWVIHGADDLEIKIYVNAVEELWISGANTGGATSLPDLLYGWIQRPGANKLCWFDQIVMDDGDDLLDIGNKLCTAKLPASVNENNWTMTGGTGAVNERPPNNSNHKRWQEGPVRQTYTLQAANVGDVDISGEEIVGYMGWAFAGTEDTAEESSLVVNNLEYPLQPLNFFNAPEGNHINFVKQPVTSSSYPSHAAGIGMLSDASEGDTILADCGVVVAYEGPVEDILFARYLLLAEQSAEVIDDLRADPPSSYMLRYRIWEDGGTVTITAYSITAEGESPRKWSITEDAPGGSGQSRIGVPGIEVRIVIEVSGADTYVMLQGYPNL